MGKIFSFIASDLDAKIEILENFLKSNNSENFVTINKMMKYEMDNNLLEKKDYVSGSRTLLRLHRGLGKLMSLAVCNLASVIILHLTDFVCCFPDFIRKFLQKVGDANNTDSLSKVGHEVYGDTLAHHHPWIVRKGANMAMYALPTREGLLKKVSFFNFLFFLKQKIDPYYC